MPLKLSRLSVLVITLLVLPAQARDLDGRYAQSPNHEWFRQLQTPGSGRCCDEADGTGVEAIDWDTKDGHYRVRVDGEWHPVPDDKVVTEPNRIGKAVVWVYRGSVGTVVRCFMPGAEG
jgi:hypothetical protein